MEELVIKRIEIDLDDDTKTFDFKIKKGELNIYEHKYSKKKK